MALTPEEQRELERLELEQLEAEHAAWLAEQGPAATDLRGMGTAVTQGATFGWGDEFTAGVAAAMAKAAGDEKPFSEIYRDIKGAEKGRQAEYTEANPKTAFALEFGGGMAVPGRFIMGGKLPAPVKNSKLWRSHEARKAARRAEETALGATRRRMFRNTGRGAAAGAFAGAGYADTMEEVPRAATTGAAFGAALPFALSTGRNTGRFLTRRRVDEDLGKGAGFMPIHLWNPASMSR